MHPAISYELAKARIADLRHQAQRDAPARAAVISRQAIAEVPMTRHQPASGHRPGQQWPWTGAEEPR
jgi:hypothetical protein